MVGCGRVTYGVRWIGEGTSSSSIREGGCGEGGESDLTMAGQDSPRARLDFFPFSPSKIDWFPLKKKSIDRLVS
jgi:hypothetical protein